MSRYRHNLPQLEGGHYLTDGGLETDLIFHHGLDLPEFAAFDLLKDEEGTRALRSYFEPYLALAREHDLGFVLESPTWRANPDWARRIGYSSEQLADMNRRAIALMEELRDQAPADGSPIVISGCVGPQDDGYNPARKMSADEAQDYHAEQVETFADTAADMVTAITMTYTEEAVGIARAAAAAGMPVAISFTVETDGRLPSAQALGDAILEVEEETGSGPAYYMLNCAHPTHFESVLDPGAPWRDRILGLRANASTKSHAELDEADELDEGDPRDLATRYVSLREQLPALRIVGGCCGTDHRHVGEICRAWVAAGPLSGA